jgi:hypothetical protein
MLRCHPLKYAKILRLFFCPTPECVSIACFLETSCKAADYRLQPESAKGYVQDNTRKTPFQLYLKVGESSFCKSNRFKERFYFYHFLFVLIQRII